MRAGKEDVKYKLVGGEVISDCVPNVFSYCHIFEQFDASARDATPA